MAAAKLLDAQDARDPRRQPHGGARPDRGARRVEPRARIATTARRRQRTATARLAHTLADLQRKLDGVFDAGRVIRRLTVGGRAPFRNASRALDEPRCVRPTNGVCRVFAALYFARVLCRVRRRAQTYALSLNDDHGDAAEARRASPPRAGSPKASRHSHLNPGFKVVSHASTWRRMPFFASRGVAAHACRSPYTLRAFSLLPRRLRGEPERRACGASCANIAARFPRDNASPPRSRWRSGCCPCRRRPLGPRRRLLGDGWRNRFARRGSCACHRP